MKTEAVPDLGVCTSCGGQHVYPLRWWDLETSTTDGENWRLELYCPECDTIRDTVEAHETVERFDATLNARTDAVITELERLEQENIETAIGWFVAALEVDAILPVDFGWPS